MRAQGQARDDSESGPAALHRPEKVRFCAGIGELDAAVRSHDLGLQQMCGAEPIGLGEAAESAAADEARDPDRHAAPAPNVAAALGHHVGIDAPPQMAPASIDTAC